MKEYLKTTILPIVTETFKKLLKVNPENFNEVVDPVQACQLKTFSPPNETFKDTDYLLFVTTSYESGSTLAYARACGQVSSGKPVIGMTNFNLNHFKIDTLDF